MQSGFSYSREMLCDRSTQVSVNFKGHQQHIEINFLNTKHFQFSLYLCYCLLSCMTVLQEQFLKFSVPRFLVITPTEYVKFKLWKSVYEKQVGRGTVRPRLLAVLFCMTYLKSLDYSNVYVCSIGNNPHLLPIHKHVN